MELIIKAASQSSFIPFSDKDAEIGIVPNMQRGDIMPMTLAGTIPATPSFLFCNALTSSGILLLPKTEITEPIAIPNM
jgi:hypothetical protein